MLIIRTGDCLHRSAVLTQLNFELKKIKYYLVTSLHFVYDYDSRPRYILKAAEEDGSIMEELPTLSSTADVRFMGVENFVLLDGNLCLNSHS